MCWASRGRTIQAQPEGIGACVGIWRERLFGTPSTPDSRFLETVLTVVETWHRQCRNNLPYLTAAMQSYFAGQPAFSALAGR
jgi:hypothetical protein